MAALPGKPGSRRVATAPEDRHPAPGRHLRVETAVSSGATAAFRPAREDRTLAVLEARRVGRYVIGHSAAKVTATMTRGTPALFTVR